MNRDRSALLCLLACAGWMSLPALGQGVHRIVGPDGRVTYSDQPPLQAPVQQASAPSAPEPKNPDTHTDPTGSTTSATKSGGTALPFALRQVSNRFPVTLYTSADCAPCNSGRNLLQARGIPYTEKTVSTPADAQALRRLTGGDTSLPLLTIGGQHVKGYEDTQWTQYLDAAGYPAQSQLPSGYRRPAPMPLVAPPPAAPAAPAEPAPARPIAPAPAQPTVPVAPPVTNPAGIRF